MRSKRKFLVRWSTTTFYKSKDGTIRTKKHFEEERLFHNKAKANKFRNKINNSKDTYETSNRVSKWATTTEL